MFGDAKQGGLGKANKRSVLEKYAKDCGFPLKVVEKLDENLFHASKSSTGAASVWSYHVVVVVAVAVAVAVVVVVVVVVVFF
jgi:hypothetical protein